MRTDILEPFVTFGKECIPSCIILATIIVPRLGTLRFRRSFERRLHLKIIDDDLKQRIWFQIKDFNFRGHAKIEIERMNNNNLNEDAPVNLIVVNAGNNLANAGGYFRREPVVGIFNSEFWAERVPPHGLNVVGNVNQDAHDYAIVANAAGNNLPNVGGNGDINANVNAAPAA
jgi:hypothetical protein